MARCNSRCCQRMVLPRRDVPFAARGLDGSSHAAVSVVPGSPQDLECPVGRRPSDPAGHNDRFLAWRSTAQACTPGLPLGSRCGSTAPIPRHRASKPQKTLPTGLDAAPAGRPRTLGDQSHRHPSAAELGITIEAHQQRSRKPALVEQSRPSETAKLTDGRVNSCCCQSSCTTSCTSPLHRSPAAAASPHHY